MNDLTKFAEEFNLKNPDLCWRHPNSDMFAWAQKCQQQGIDPGMGDLTQPCRPRPGNTCPACGKIWE
jgi:hypothetical protein